MADKPTLLLWGMKDPAFGARDLRRWTEQLTRARTVPLPDVGHFVPEEAPDRVVEEVERFLREDERPQEAVG